MKNKMKFNILLSWSKIMALVILIAAIFLEIKGETKGTIFMFTIPFITALITGKQIIDRNKK